MSIPPSSNGGFAMGPHAVSAWRKLICQPQHELTERELREMSIVEKIRVYGDLGGAQDIHSEYPDFVRQALLDLDSNIASIQQKDAFELAQRLAPQYTDSVSFRLKFLRAECFDVVKASQRIVTHFQEKLELFGPEVLGRTICLADLNEEDLKTLFCGGLQILPNTDQFGRQILFSRQAAWWYQERENLLRTIWYLCEAVVETEDAQRRGVVVLGYSVGNKEVKLPIDYELLRRAVKLLSAVPVRFLAIYACFNSSAMEPVADFATHIFNKFLRARFRCIRGKLIMLLLDGLPNCIIPCAGSL
jgi:hypothetical protein